MRTCKRFPWLILAFSLLTACGGGGGGDSSEPTPPPAPPPPPSPVTLPPGWSAIADMPYGLAHFAGVNIGRKIYLAGGYDREQALFIYDLDANSWSQGAMLPAGTDSMSAVVHQNKMYVIGGEANQTVQIYDPSTNTWQTLRSLPSPRFSSVTQKLGDQVHLIGGWNYNNVMSNSLSSHEVYNLLDDSVSPLQLAPLLVARNCAASGIIDGKIYVAAGRAPGIRTNDSTALGSVEMYSPEIDAWDYRQNISTARACAASTVFQNKLYVFGGEIPPSTFSKVVERYLPSQNIWEPVGDMPEFTSGAVAIAVDDAIYVFGGYTNSNTSARTEQASKKAYRFVPQN